MTFSQFNRASSKLTGDKVIEIRQKYATRQYTQEALSREYQVSINTIRNILRGVSWQNLPTIKSEAEEQTEAKLSEHRFATLLRLEADIAKVQEPERQLDQFINPEARRRYLGALPEPGQQQSAERSGEQADGQEDSK